MLKSKKILIVLLIGLLFFLPVTVFAADTTNLEAIKTFDDGKEHTLNEDITANGCDGAIFVTNGSKLTIDGGNIHALCCDGEKCGDPTCGFNMALWAKGEGVEVTIKDGYFTNEGDGTDHSDLIYVRAGAMVYIEGGTFKCDTPKWTLNGKDNSPGQIIVTGGRFYKLDPSNTQVSGGADEVVVPAGYKVVQDGDWYEVVQEESVAAIKTYDDGKEHTLNEDVTANGCDGAIFVTNGSKLTIDGGNIHALCCNGTKCGDPTCGFNMALWAKGEGVEVTIKDGYFTNEGDGTDHSDLIYVRAGAMVYIEGGTFKCDTPKWTLNGKDNSPGQIIVTGGRFYKLDPSNTQVSGGADEVIVPEGYKVVQDGDWYEVVCAHLDCTEVKEVPATYTENGTKAHWVCDACEKTFADKDATTELTDLVIPKLIEVVDNNANVSAGAIDKAVTEAGNDATVVLPVEQEGVSSVTLPVGSLTDLADSDKELTIETPDVVVTIDNATLAEVVAQAEDVESVIVEVVKVEKEALTETQKEAIKDKEVAMVLSAQIIADGKNISDFKGGKVTVEVPFVPAENSKVEDYKVVYIADDGKIEEIPFKYVDGKIVLELEHFSEYAIVKDAVTSAEGEKDESPKTGSKSIVVCVIMISLVGLAVTKKRK